jgi:RNA polymerase primary sigma factor
MGENTTGLRTYLSEIGQHRVLSREEEFELFERIRAGSQSARQEVIHCNLRLVVRIAQRFQGKGLLLEDLIQEGNIGLVEVINRFDHKLGFRFSTYAAFWIRQAIQVAIRKQGALIRLPVRKMRQLGRIHEIIQEFYATKGRAPTQGEIAKRLRISADQVDELLQWSRTTLSLDAPLDEDGGDTLKDHVVDQSAVLPAQETMQRELRGKVHEALKQLTEREHSIIQLRFGLKGHKVRSLRKISRHVGLSQEGVRRIEKRALAKLSRPHLRAQLAGLL